MPPLSLVVTPGQRADCTQFKPVLEKIRIPKPGPGRSRNKPDSVAADKAYSNGPCCQRLRNRGIRYTMRKPTARPPAYAKAAAGHQPSTMRGTATHHRTGLQRQTLLRLQRHRNRRSPHHLTPNIIDPTSPKGFFQTA
ncbi:transposase [Streptomyces sp. NPDC101149]|uniref:transposase n=1 Tax=Streptomyces sp. NPDC101149 TaxID=3366113 RepID=UPI00382A438A